MNQESRIYQAGFTLIELVITITVIGILSAALIATYASLSQSAQKAAQEASLAAVQSQIAIQLGSSPLHQFPTMLELQEALPNLEIGSYHINAATSVGGKTAETLALPSPFMLYPANNNNQLGSSNFIFYMNTSAGPVVFIPFTDAACQYPLGVLSSPLATVTPNNTVTQVNQASSSLPPATTVPVNPAPNLNPIQSLTGGNDGATLSYSLADFMVQNPGLKTYPAAPKGAQVLCVRMANTSEINQNFALIAQLGGAAP